MAQTQQPDGGKTLPSGCEPGCEIGPKLGTDRKTIAVAIRNEATQYRAAQGDFDDHPCNGDEAKYVDSNFIGNFTKGLPHHPGSASDAMAGEVQVDAYCQLLKALTSGDPEEFAKIPLGCAESDGGPAEAKQLESRFAPGGTARPTYKDKPSSPPPPNSPRKLVNPQAALAYALEGADSHQLKITAAPAFDTAEEAGEMIELYWMAMARDVPFAEYCSDPITQAAIADLNRFIAAHPNDFEGPTVDLGSGTRGVDSKTLFRGASKFGTGDFNYDELVGPYLSQFLLHDAPYGAQVINQRINTTKPVVKPDKAAGNGKDYLTTWDDWLEVQDGCEQPGDLIDTLTQRYIRNGRDISQYVHIDVLFQTYFNAVLILLQAPSAANSFAGFRAPFDESNPYLNSPGKDKEEGFGTFGGAHIATLVCEVATRALKAVWYQKWAVHRRLRPEAFGGWVEKIRANSGSSAVKERYPVHEALLNSDALGNVASGIGSFPGYGNHLLPMAFPEGSPVHPAYGAGHATVAGACVTVLKAWFKEETLLKDLKDRDGQPLQIEIVEAKLTNDFSTDGIELSKYTGDDADKLTIRSELNKLAANVGIGRNHAGVHWRSDHDQSILLGERIAISVLEDQACTYNEALVDDVMFTFTTFAGEKREIKRRASCPKTR